MDEDLKKNILTTGTSLVGLVCKDGLVMAGDRRVTAGGQIVMSKDYQKVMMINDYLVISGTGVVSDFELLKKLISAELRLKELKDKVRPSIKECANLIAMIAYKNIRQPSMVPFIAGTMIGGFDEEGTTSLYSIEPSGSAKKISDYDANYSSGMPYILGLLERQYKKDITVEQGIALVIEAIKSSSERDPASGNGIDVFTITKHGIKHIVKQISKPEYSEQ